MPEPVPLAASTPPPALPDRASGDGEEGVARPAQAGGEGMERVQGVSSDP